jgi:hypothetical protein
MQVSCFVLPLCAGICFPHPNFFARAYLGGLRSFLLITWVNKELKWIELLFAVIIHILYEIETVQCEHIYILYYISVPNMFRPLGHHQKGNVYQRIPRMLIYITPLTMA